MKKGFVLKVLFAIVLAVMAGSLTGANSTIAGLSFIRIYDLIGQLFLNGLTLVVVPLVMSSIVTGTARLGNESSFSSLSAKTFTFFVMTTFVAVLIGFTLTMWLEPGLFYHADLESLSHLHIQEQGDGFDKISQVFLMVVPSNIFETAAQGKILGLIFFSMAFGLFSARIPPHLSSILIGFWEGMFQVMLKMTNLVMRALPVGVFGLVAKVVATTGLDTITPVALFFSTVMLGLATFALIFLPLLLWTIARLNPINFFRAMAPALFTAFCTSSSAATLPVTIDCLEKRASLSTRITSFVVPIGGTINLAGTALYSCSAVVFIAQAYGAELDAGMQLMIFTMAFLTSFGVAGIPSATLITLVIMLQMINIPTEGIGLILAVDRFLDMARTPVNALTNATCAALVSRTERLPAPITATT